MTHRFDPSIGAILVQADVTGPRGLATFTLLLDTGANTTVLGETAIQTIGFDPLAPPGQVPVTTASGTSVAGVFIVPAITALGTTYNNWPVVCYPLPAEVNVDGLLGLDFLEGHVLTLDFVNHTLSLV